MAIATQQEQLSATLGSHRPARAQPTDRVLSTDNYSTRVPTVRTLFLRTVLSAISLSFRVSTGAGLRCVLSHQGSPLSRGAHLAPLGDPRWSSHERSLFILEVMSDKIFHNAFLYNAKRHADALAILKSTEYNFCHF